MSLKYWLPELDAKIFWNDLQVICTAAIVSLFLAFVLAFIGREDLISRRARLLFLIEPFLLFFMLLTDSAFSLFRVGPDSSSGRRFSNADFQSQVLAGISILYTCICSAWRVPS